MIITVHHPYYNEIRFRLNAAPIDIENVQLANSLVRIDPHRDVNFCKYEKLGREIKEALTNIRTTEREEAVAAAAPKPSMTCPYCGERNDFTQRNCVRCSNTKPDLGESCAVL